MSAPSSQVHRYRLKIGRDIGSAARVCKLLMIAGSDLKKGTCWPVQVNSPSAKLALFPLLRTWTGMQSAVARRACRKKGSSGNFGEP